jgi:hypothetical protein
MPDPIVSSGSSAAPVVPGDARGLVQRVSPMQRLLSFAGRSIDDVVNCPIARRHVIVYYRVGRQIARAIEVAELEQQWNPLGRR